MPAATRGSRTRPNTISPGVGAPSSSPSERAAPCSTSAMPSGYGPTASAKASAATSAATSSRRTAPRIRSAPAAAGLRAGEDAVELRVAHLGLVEQLDEVARDAADVLRKFLRIEQARDP